MAGQDFLTFMKLANIAPYIFSFFFCFAFAKAQIVINELDADTQGVDDLEFIELKTPSPFTPLDGYVLVLFNGSSSGNDSSYFAYDLDGITTDFNGLTVIGTNLVSPVPDRIISENTFQNGADAAAIYIGDESDFPEMTLATTTNLVDALVYDTNDSDDQVLLSLLGLSVQYNEDENGNKDTESLQRDANGNYTAAAPTPFSFNNSSTPSFVGVSFQASVTALDEGDNFDITYTLTETRTTDFVLNLSLNNNGFDTSDYNGPTQITIPAGSTSFTANYQIIDDALDEGDEVLRINIQNNLPDGYKRLRDNVRIRVTDNDFQVAAYGTPLNPTYDQVTSTAAPDYYDSLEGLSGTALETAITDIIADPNLVRAQTYADVNDILKEADVSPLNSNQVWLVYTEQQRPKLDIQTGSDNTDKWNREHLYPRSRGGFFTIEYDEVADGIVPFTTSKFDSTRHGISDAHALRPADGGENSSRGNQDYGEYDGPAGNQGSWKGDVARAIFFMDLRYKDMDVVTGDPSNSTVGQLGDLTTLLQWHRNDPPDDYEMHRNNVVEVWQQNRNPFIDLPDLVEYVYGNQVGNNFTLGLGNVNELELAIFPNPTSGPLKIKGLEQPAQMQMYNLQGQRVLQSQVMPGNQINLNLPEGIYLAHFSQGDRRSIFKVVVR